MNFSNFPSDSGKPSPRKEIQIQGPRPAALKIRKESHKVKKPPAVPQHRSPVIIYAVSPKVIHTNPNEFLSLVQRLTGSNSTVQDISNNQPEPESTNDIIEVIDSDRNVESVRTGILSPIPSSMPAISPNFFEPPVVDTSTSIGFLQGMSPVGFGGGNRNFADNTFLVSPGNLFSTNLFPSPTAYWDLFNQYQNQ